MAYQGLNDPLIDRPVGQAPLDDSFKQVQFNTMLPLAFGAVPANYTVAPTFSFSDFRYGIAYIRITNGLNANIAISFDGVNDNLFFLPSTSDKVLWTAGNRSLGYLGVWVRYEGTAPTNASVGPFVFQYAS